MKEYYTKITDLWYGKPRQNRFGSGWVICPKERVDSVSVNVAKGEVKELERTLLAAVRKLEYILGKLVLNRKDLCICKMAEIKGLIAYTLFPLVCPELSDSYRIQFIEEKKKS